MESPTSSIKEVLSEKGLSKHGLPKSQQEFYDSKHLHLQSLTGKHGIAIPNSRDSACQSQGFDQSKR